MILNPHEAAAGPGGPKGRRKTAVAALALAVSGAALGWLLGLLWPDPVRAPSGALELRSGSYRFINPLLECQGDDERGFAELEPFQDDIARLIARRSGGSGVADAAVYFRDLNNGPWFGVREQEKFVPASLLKLPVVIAAMKQAERDPSFLSRQVRNDLAEDHTALQLVKPSRALVRGAHYTVDDLIERCLVLSDNNALQLLVRAVDPNILLGVFRDFGVPGPTFKMQYDFISPRAYASFFRILFNASYLSRASSQRLLDLLARAEYRDGLAAAVPSYVLVAQKFGEYAPPAPRGLRQLHDCGIVYYPGHPFLLCVMTRGNDFSAMTDLIRDVSRLVYERIDLQYRQQASEAVQ